MSLQVLIRELLEIVKDLFLDDRCKALHLLDKDTLMHLNLAGISYAKFGL